MRLLLVLLAFLALPGLAMVNMCPTGILSETTLDTDVPGQTYTANGCTFIGHVLLSAVETPASTEPISISIKNTAVKDRLSIYLFSSGGSIPLPTRPTTSTTTTPTTTTTGATSTTTTTTTSISVMTNSIGPLYITVENNVFEHNAGFYIRYALPPNSVLTFQNNQMSGIGTTDSFGSSRLSERMSIGIQDLMLFSNSVLNIIGNTLAANEQSYAYYQLVHMNDVTVKGKGTINILNNTMSLYNIHHGSFIQHRGVCKMHGAFALHIESNTFSGSARQYLPILWTETISSPDGQRNNLLSISNNKFDLYVEDLDSSVIALVSFSNIDLALNGNNISSNGNLFLHGHADFAPGRYASIVGNMYASTSPITGLYSLIHFTGYQFVENSVLTIARNTVTAPTVLRVFVNMDNVDYRRTSTIKQCGNKLPWSDFPASSEQMFRPLILSTGLVSYDTDLCGGNIITTAESITPPTPSSTPFVSTHIHARTTTAYQTSTKKSQLTESTTLTKINVITNPAQSGSSGSLLARADNENKALLVVAIIVPVVGFLALAAGAVIGVLEYKRRKNTVVADMSQGSGDHVTIVVFTESPEKLCTEPVTVERAELAIVRGPDFDGVL